jgi:hypothetical protein
MTSSGALKAGKEIATVAMKIMILKIIQTVKPFWLNRTANAKQSWFSKKRKAGQICPAFVVMRFIRLHPGAQKGDTANLWSAVRTASQAKPLCQPRTDSEVLV